MVYDPFERKFYVRKIKVTNIKENTRIMLTKPLTPVEEAGIEIRRKGYLIVFNKYKRKETIQGRQKTNMPEKEEKRLKSIIKRVDKKDIVIP